MDARRNLWKKYIFFLDSRHDNITGLSIRYALYILAIPASLRLLGHFLFEIVDAYWLGQLGKDALAAVGGSSLYIWAYYSLMGLTLTGINAMVSQAVGADHLEKSVRIAGIGVLASFLWSLIFIALYLSCQDWMLQMVGLTGVSLEYGYQYFLPFILASPIYYLWCCFEEILNARGQTHLNFLIVLLALSLNAVLDPLLIHGYGPFPRWEVAGAQIASILSATVGLILTAYFSLRRRYVSYLCFDRKVVLRMAKIGFPKMVSSLVFSLTYVGLVCLIQRFGMEALAAWMICHRLEGFAYYLSMGFCTAATVMVGQYIGAGRQDRMRKAVFYNIGLLSLVLSLNAVILIIVGRTLLRLFINDPKVIEYGAAYLTIVAITHVFMGWELVMDGAFSGMGNTLPHLCLCTPLTISRIPISYFLIPCLGINGVFWAISLTTLIKGMAMSAWFLVISRKAIKAIQSTA